MHAAHTPYVRQHQVWVLASLQLATKPVTPREIAELLNARQDETKLPPTDSGEVEASLAALMLRPTLRHFISCNTRRATTAEAARRRRLGLGSLSTVVILSACSAIQPTTPPVPNGRALHSYFGGAIPAQKEEPAPSRPVFSSTATFAQAYAQAVEITAQDPDVFVAKTPADRTPTALASYFDDDGTFVRYAKRQDADLAPELKTANAPPPPVDMVAINVEPLPLLSLSLAQNAPAQPHGTLSATPAPAPSLPLLNPTSTAFVAPISTAAEPKPASSSRGKLDLGDTERPDVYSELVSFANGSIVLSPSAAQRVAALVEAAKHADAIQLRGRVGNRQLDTSMAKVAVARAIAVRSALEAQGVPRSKIRIHMPRNADFVVAGDPAHEANRSVSIFMVVPEAQAAALGLHHGKPILTASLDGTTR